MKPGKSVEVITCSKEIDMKIARAARTILSVTALAWAILSAAEVRNFREYAGRGANDSAITGRVKTALLREPELKSLDVSVETFKGEVHLSGFVRDEGLRAKAVKAASTVAGVSGVKDSLTVRN
jgi:osmotically-inducible protein OsmY